MPDSVLLKLREDLVKAVTPTSVPVHPIQADFTPPLGLSMLFNKLTSPLVGTPNSEFKLNGWENIDEKLICQIRGPSGRMKKMIKCADCDYITTAPSHYFRHEIKHSKVKPFGCPFCPQMFQRRYKIKSHIMKEHAIDNVENILPK